MPPIKVLIADDHTLVREGVSALLALYDDIEVVAEAADGKEAVEQAAKRHPEVVLMDIAMPGLGGLEATIEITKSQPDVKILVLTQYDDREYLSRFLKAGASGYVLKKALGSDLARAIRAVSKGEFYLDPSIASQVVDGYLQSQEEAAAADPYERLTDREKQVLKLIAEGLTHKEIATELNISTRTAITHQTNISDKLGMHSKAELIKFAIAHGIIKLET